MEVVAQTKHLRISPRKVRLVADLIRGMKAQEAVDILGHLNKGASQPMLLIVKQGIGNAANNFNLDKASLIIKKLEIGKGPTYKRGQPVSRGMWHPILKRTCHVRMVLEGKEQTKKQKKIAKKGKKDGSKS